MPNESSQQDLISGFFISYGACAGAYLLYRLARLFCARASSENQGSLSIARVLTTSEENSVGSPIVTAYAISNNNASNEPGLQTTETSSPSFMV